jgi:hypothetical protein
MTRHLISASQYVVTLGPSPHSKIDTTSTVAIKVNALKCSAYLLYYPRSRSMESEVFVPETSGLLDQDRDAVESARNAENRKTIGLAQMIRKRVEALISSRTFRLTASVFLVYFLLEVSLLVLQVPGSRLYERAVCRRYYRDTPSFGSSFNSSSEIDERLCKLAPIQREVALLVGWRDSLLAIPSEWLLWLMSLDQNLTEDFQVF